MTRDYKNVTEAGTKQKKTRAKSKKKAQAENSLPGWVWLVSGVVIGGFVSFIVYLKLNVPVDGQQASIEREVPVAVAPQVVPKNLPKTVSVPEQKKQDGSELEFYNVLTNKESLFPENAKADDAKEKALDIGKVESKTTNRAIEQKIRNETKHVTYLYTLQVGSFLAFKDADKRKANLAMLGIGSRIHSIKTRNVVRYRVMVGPYDDLKRIRKIDAEMKANNIKTLLLKEKG